MCKMRFIIISFIVLGFSDRTTNGIIIKEVSLQPKAVSPTINPFFRKDYLYIPSVKSFYKFHQVRLNWKESKLRCTMEGSQLWIPESEEEVAVVTAEWMKRYPYIRNIYLGIHDLLSEGDFVTIDGRNIQDVYNKWIINQPNNFLNKEDCVVMTRNGLMHDVFCYSHINFLCKKTLATMTWNFLCNLPDPDYLYNKDIGKCYKIHKSRKTWAQAYSICNAEESYLAVINSQTEADVIVKMLDDSPIRNNTRNGHVLLMGFHNEFDNVWTTVHGLTLEEAGFDKWVEDEANDYDFYHKYNNCGALTYTGELNDVNCRSYQYFICEHDVDVLSVSIDERFSETNFLV